MQFGIMLSTDKYHNTCANAQGRHTENWTFSRVSAFHLIFTLLFFISGCATTGEIQGQRFKPQEDGILVAHALGGMDGKKHTNSKEAFLKSYAEGKRWFEVDLFVLADGNLVCYHRFLDERLGLKRGEARKLATEEFLKLKMDGQYTLLSFEDLLRLIKERPDAIIILDAKGWEEDKKDAMIRHLNHVDPALASQIIPQIYNPVELPLIEEIEAATGPFRTLIMALYLSIMTDQEVLSFVREENISIVMITTESPRLERRFLKKLKKADRYVFMQAVDDPDEMKEWTAKGVNSFYTDFL